jgi:hypothetical protein
MMQMAKYLASVPFYASATCCFDLLKAAVRDRQKRDLPDAGGSRFLTLNGGFGGANRSLTGQYRALAVPKSLPRSSHSRPNVS